MVTNLKSVDKPTRPVLRYHGGKYRLAAWVISHFPKHRAYAETFGGAASVLMLKPRCFAEIYNDLDGEIVNVFRVLRDPTMARQLKHDLELTPFARAEFESAYLKSGDPIEQARRTIIKSFMGFGSNAIHASTCKPPTGFRGMARLSGTTPAHDWTTYTGQIDVFCSRLRGVVIENRPAIQIIKTHDKADVLHYVDPPYVGSTRDAGKDYRFELSDDEHRELSEVLHNVKGMVVLSGYASALYEDLYAGWQQFERPHLADGARLRTEVLWLNASAQAALNDRRAPLFAVN